jgi:hypothetical protein
LLLGGGRLAGNARVRFGTSLLHTNNDIPGVRHDAKQLGYGGGNSMSFLRLHPMAFPAAGHPPVAGLGQLPNALSQASVAQSAILSGMLTV